MNTVSLSQPAVSKIVSRALLCAVCCSPLVVWLMTVPEAHRYLRLSGVPAGQSLYVMAKLLGLFAISLFWLQCILALARPTPLARWLPSIGRGGHIALGSTTVICILLHIGLFVTAASWRTGHVAWDLLLPSVGRGFYRTSVGLGAAALWVCLLAVYGGRRLALGGTRWKWVHMLWPLVFGLVFVHAINIGTESRYGVMRYVLWGLLVSLLVMATTRIMVKRGDRNQRM
jgi:predicted ferric reductase